jgi:hypothetical protein
MAKISKAKLKEQLDEWAEAKRAEEQLIAECEAEIAPIRERFEKKCAPIREQYTAAILSWQQRASEIETAISENLLSNLNEDGSVAITEIIADGAKAQVMTTGKREIEPSAFFDTTPEPARDKSFWGCVQIGIAKAEKFLGSRIDAIAQKKFSHRVQITLK